MLFQIKAAAYADHLECSANGLRRRVRSGLPVYAAPYFQDDTRFFTLQYGKTLSVHHRCCFGLAYQSDSCTSCETNEIKLDVESALVKRATYSLSGGERRQVEAYDRGIKAGRRQAEEEATRLTSSTFIEVRGEQLQNWNSLDAIDALEKKIETEGLQEKSKSCRGAAILLALLRRWIEQSQSIREGKKTRSKYPAEILEFCRDLWDTNKKGFAVFKSAIGPGVPSESTMHNHQRAGVKAYANSRPTAQVMLGVIDDLKNGLISKHVAVSTDSMKLTKKILYDHRRGAVVGLCEHMGTSAKMICRDQATDCLKESSDVLADEYNVIVLHDLQSNETRLLCGWATSGVHKEMIHDTISGCIRTLQVVGFEVKAICFDAAQSNKGFHVTAAERKANPDFTHPKWNNYITIGGAKIYVIYDFYHTIKKIRNAHERKAIRLIDPEETPFLNVEEVTWDTLKASFPCNDVGQLGALHGRATTDAFNLTPWGRLAVHLALIIFNDEAQENYDKRLPLMKKHAKVIHDYYNAMKGDKWSSMLVTNMDDTRIIAIQDMLDYMLDWRRCIETEMDALGLINTKDEKARTKYLERHFLPHGQLYHCIVNDCTAVLELAKEMIDSGAGGIRLGSLSSDPCEKTFLDMRSRGGKNLSAQAAQFQSPRAGHHHRKGKCAGSRGNNLSSTVRRELVKSQKVQNARNRNIQRNRPPLQPVNN